MENFSFYPGNPYRLGAYPTEAGFSFAIMVSDAKEVALCLFSLDGAERVEIPLDPLVHRTENIWHLEVRHLQQPFAYGYRKDNEPYILLDPYAKGIYAPRHRQKDLFLYHPLGTVPSPAFDWQGISRPLLPLENLVIYEIHVRGFTRHPSSRVVHAGSFLGVIEKIDHLKSLGINAVELLPIFEFNEKELDRCAVIGRKRLGNYWGYSSVSFFAPMNGYTVGEAYDDATKELKTLIRELHRAGIAVILDVVYNHTAEGNHLGPIYSYKHLGNSIYYLMNADGTYQNHSGCGNTFNVNHPVVRQHILDSLRYWATEFHVDGFRFDLASILTRDLQGDPLPCAPLLQEMADDPVLATLKLIAEPWDMSLYQVGSFYTQSQARWSEWNGRYRDAVRRFIAGHRNSSGEFATRICGSQDLYGQGSPLNSLNFITAHDGFTLADLVSYNQKHNEENGEGNRDGLCDNLSWNCGIEGPTADLSILQRRQRQMRNLLLALFISRGIPMLSMGDEYGHTRNGNNNSWSADNDLNWFRWDLLENTESQNLMKFIATLINLRKSSPSLTEGRFLTDRDILWHGLQPLQPNWGPENQFVAFTLKGIQEIYVAFNTSQDTLEAALPQGPPWHLVVDTSDRKEHSGFTISLIERSAVVLVREPENVLKD